MRSLALLLFSLTAFLLSSNAFAQNDAKNYAGSTCITFEGGIRSLSSSVLENASTTSEMKVDCVAVRDGLQFKTAFGTATDFAAFIKVRDVNPGPGLDVSCNLIVSRQFGNTGESVGAGSRTTTGRNSLFWTNLYFPSVSMLSDAYAYFSCSIPRATAAGARSAIAMYQVVETGAF